MSRRTSEANKAVASAWVNEKQLVFNGRGTRDWTSEQQSQILDKGKAYDDDGKAFEGHHMKSVEAYSEFQGEPSNIQFLSRVEHLDAHNGNTQNPTNGYYNLLTGETEMFTEDSCEPCKIIELSEPIKANNENTDSISERENEQNRETTELDDTASEHLISDDKKHDSITQQHKSGRNDNSAGTGAARKSVPKETVTSRKKKAGLLDKVATTLGFRTPADLGRATFHSIVRVIKVAAPIAAPIIIESVFNSRGSKNSNQTNSNRSNRSTNSTPVDFSELSNTSDSTRSSPIKHTVSESGQHYNTNTGRVWKIKAPYERGSDVNE